MKGIMIEDIGFVGLKGDANNDGYVNIMIL